MAGELSLSSRESSMLAQRGRSLRRDRNEGWPCSQRAAPPHYITGNLSHQWGIPFLPWHFHCSACRPTCACRVLACRVLPCLPHAHVSEHVLGHIRLNSRGFIVSRAQGDVRKTSSRIALPDLVVQRRKLPLCLPSSQGPQAQWKRASERPRPPTKGWSGGATSGSNGRDTPNIVWGPSTTSSLR